MMEWRDEALVLASRPQGESAALVSLFSRNHGRYEGILRGGASRKIAPSLQPGTGVQAEWQARESSALGSFKIEPIKSRAHLMADREALALLSAACALLQIALPERAPEPRLWQQSLALLDGLEGATRASDYLYWEISLLDALGYGLDLGSCAVTGATEGLAYVSPKTGRAVTASGAGDYAERLFALPEGFRDGAPLSGAALIAGLRITGHFLAKLLQEDQGRMALPDARNRLITLLSRAGRDADKP